jgi:hypothetical protein
VVPLKTAAHALTITPTPRKSTIWMIVDRRAAK